MCVRACMRARLRVCVCQSVREREGLRYEGGCACGCVGGGDMVYGCGCEGGMDENSDYTCAEYIDY